MARIQQIGVEFTREKRFAGETKYPFSKMLKFAFDAITSFFLEAAETLFFPGSATFGLKLYLPAGRAVPEAVSDRTVPGWASTMVVNLFFNGIILMMLGIAGEYIGRIYDETKGRPLYVVRRDKKLCHGKGEREGVAVLGTNRTGH